MIRWIGGLLVILGCGSCGISIATEYLREQQRLGRLYRALCIMEWELKYRLTPLSELCRLAAKESGGSVEAVFRRLAGELDAQTEPEVDGCMQAALAKVPELSPTLRKIMKQLGRSLGRFDLTGQIQGLQAVREAVQTAQDRLDRERGSRLKCYRTLGFCTGAALVILFI